MAREPTRTRAQLENSISQELSTAGNRAGILDLERRYREFMAANFPQGDPRALKHGYAFRLSTALARTVADSLRADFPGILPDVDGRGGESAAPVHSGFKRLDVNYSTQQLGLALGVSIKTLNFPDDASGRFTKNATRIDNELRAEAQDYHHRQPYCVMAALVFVPHATTRDPGVRGRTSFRYIYEVLSKRSRRAEPGDDHDKFELVYLITYDDNETSSTFGHLRPLKVLGPSDAQNDPGGSLSFEDIVREIGATFIRRNQHHRLAR